MSEPSPSVPSGITVEYVPIDSLRPASYNPRKWTPEEAAKLMESMKRFGMIEPLIVNQHPDRMNVIVGGHFRWAVAKESKFETIPVVYVYLPLEKEKELNLRLNRNTGQWDFEILKDLGIDLLLDVGFDNQDLSDIWDSSLETDEDDFSVEKELAKIQTPTTKPGDIFALGTHRLLCGDSTDLNVVSRLMNGELADMIYCDPPFNIGLSYHEGISTSGKYGGKKTNDRLSFVEYRSFLAKTMKNALASAKPDCHVFYWCDENYVGLLQGLFAEHALTNKRTCLWVKNNFNLTPGVAFNKAYEPCVYAIRGKPYLDEKVRNLNEVMNKEIGIGNRAMEDIEELFDIWLAKRLAGQDYEHPTEKPPTLHEKPLRRCTKINDLVLDLFGGSGSTLIACEQMKRRCFTVELEPIFCDLIIKRYESLTGTKAKLLN